jgi:hypothetical protein
MILPTIFLLLTIAIFGTACYGIYLIIKNHFKKDEELFP